jgi:hypothetical protein
MFRLGMLLLKRKNQRKLATFGLKRALPHSKRDTRHETNRLHEVSLTGFRHRSLVILHASTSRPLHYLC